MKCFKQQVIFFVGLILIAGLSGCSKDDIETVIPPEPGTPPITTVPLTGFEVLLGNAATRADIEAFNQPKTAFVATDHFALSYSNTTQASQTAYAYTSDGKTWTVHEKEDANSPVKTVLLDATSPAFNAAYLPTAAVNAGADKDGIVAENGTDAKILVGCFDALRATAEVTVNANKATAKIPFKHINHLLNIYIKGTINERFIQSLELDVTYTNAAGTQQNAVLSTSSRANYADIEGTAHTVIQVIVPRDAIVKGIRAIKNDDSEITAPDVINIDCPGGKSHLITLNVNDAILSVQVGSLTDDWASGGELNPDGSPVGDIYIGTADELRRFSEAVNTNPSKPVSKIDGILAATAHVVQTADINLSSLAWRPIGGNIYEDEEGNIEVTYFAGTYNGNGYKISGMKVTTSTASGHSLSAFAGMFGNVQSPAVGYTVLTNIHLVNVDIKQNASIDYSAVGPLAALAYAPTGTQPIVISQCSAQGTIEVNNNGGQITAGGLVGEAIRAHITGSYTDVSVTTNSSGYSYAGGVAGRAQSSSIVSSYTMKDVTGQSTNGTSVAGGIAGALNTQNEFGNIIACSSEGNVTSNGKVVYAGGVAGYNDGNLTGSYAKGNATSASTNAKMGAIAGSGSSTINLCYGVGAVGAGNSAVVAIADNKVYKTNPAAGDILSIVSGAAWKNAHGTEMAKATIGGILTTIPVNTGGKLVQEVKSRLWVLSDPDVWTTSAPANNIYPLPESSYKGE